MSGGLAFVYDPKDNLRDLCNLQMVDIDPLTDEKLAKLKNKIEVHVKYTDSQVGKRIIGNWSEEHKLFKLVFPKDYKVLLAIEKARKEGTSEELAIMEAAHG